MAIGVVTADADPDLWGHVRFGLDFLHSFRLPRLDPYSFTQDIAWTNHEWLSEAIMGAAYAAAGPMGLVILKGALLICAYALVASALKKSPDGARWGSLALVAAAVLPIAHSIRPQLWTLLFLVVLCRLLLAPPRYLWFVPVLFVPWVNVHGGWVVGFGVLTAWSASALLDPSTSRRTRLIVGGVFALSLLATLVNPYGFGLWQFVLETVRPARADIQEWQPTLRAPAVLLLLWTGGVGFAVWAVWRRPRVAIRTVAVITMMAAGSLLVTRLIPLFVATTVLLLAPALEGRPAAPPAPVRTALDLAAMVVAVLLATHVSLLDGCVRVEGSWVPDVTAARSLSASHARGRAITWFDWGEYALWHLWPSLKISYDGRRETVYSKRTIDEQRAIAGGDPEGMDALGRLAPEYVWLSNAVSGKTKAWLREHGYRIDVETARSFVAVRKDLPTVTTVTGSPASCFPAP